MDDKNTERTVVTDRSRSTFMPFVVGALAVAVVVLGWLFLGGEAANGPADVDVQIEQPAGDGSQATGNTGEGAGAGAGGDAGAGADANGGNQN